MSVPKEKIEEIIKEYLSDEIATKMYHDWWRGEVEAKASNDEEFTATEKLPRLETIKGLFNLWFEKNQNSLREQICPHWIRLRQQSDLKQLSNVDIIIHMALASLFVAIPTVPLITILVVGGYLDKLCATCDDWEDEKPSHDNRPIPKKPQES